MGIKTSITDDDILDIHSVSSVLKTYFRELPNPLFTYELYFPLVVCFSHSPTCLYNIQMKIQYSTHVTDSLIMYM